MKKNIYTFIDIFAQSGRILLLKVLSWVFHVIDIFPLGKLHLTIVSFGKSTFMNQFSFILLKILAEF